MIFFEPRAVRASKIGGYFRPSLGFYETSFENDLISAARSATYSVCDFRLLGAGHYVMPGRVVFFPETSGPNLIRVRGHATCTVRGKKIIAQGAMSLYFEGVEVG